MKQYSKKIVLLFVFAVFPFSVSAKELVMGVFPYLDPASVAKLHGPIKNYFSDKLGLKIRMVTAPSFKAFVKNTHQRQYDILITAPHLGRLAEKKAGYQWLGFSANYSHAVFAVKSGGEIRSIQDIKGKAITLPPKTAIIHQLALSSMKAAGLDVEKDVIIKETKSHNNAMLSVIKDTTPVAAFGLPTWNQFKPAGKDNLKVLMTSEDIPGFAFMVNKAMSSEHYRTLFEAFQAYDQTKQGKSYFEQAGLKGSRETTQRDMDQMDRYLARIKAAKQGQK